MQTKGLFSPSLELRSEPPNTTGLVVSVTKDGKGRVRRALTRFKGQTVDCRSLHFDLTVGEMVCVVEAPRGMFWVRRTGPSWYAKPLTDWLKSGRYAQVAMEYFLRDCRKFSPFIVVPKDPADRIDEDDDWELREKPFTLEGDADGVERVAVLPTGELESSVAIACSPSHLAASGTVTVTWSSSGETDVSVFKDGVILSHDRTGSATVNVLSTSIFEIVGGSGSRASSACFVGGIEPGWWVYGSGITSWQIFIVADGKTNASFADFLTADGYEEPWNLVRKSFASILVPDVKPYYTLKIPHGSSPNWYYKTFPKGHLYYGYGQLQYLSFDSVALDRMYFKDPAEPDFPWDYDIEILTRYWNEEGYYGVRPSLSYKHGSGSGTIYPDPVFIYWRDFGLVFGEYKRRSFILTDFSLHSFEGA